MFTCKYPDMQIINGESSVCMASCRHYCPRKYWILVIDDELTVCKSCQKILGEDGYSVSTVLSGLEGLKRATQENFDLVIVDLKMPDLDGMEVVEEIKREQSDTAVIIMTGYSTVPSAVQGMKLGAADYIPKPFTPDEMSAAVKKALQQKEQRVEKPETEETGLLINKDTIISVLTRAAQDKEFVAQLSNQGIESLEEYELTPAEKAALVSVIHPSDEEAMLIVSHELKSPLSSIVSLAKTIQQQGLSGDQREKFLTRIVTRAEHTLEMIEEYLKLSKISAGEMDLEPRRVNVYKEVIQKALDDQSEAMAEKGINARIEVPEELEVVCDPEYMRIVYNNLLSNATKYGTPQTEIFLGYAGLREESQYFNVANVGEWIKEGDRKRIFEKFVTLGKRGTGIGLNATKQILKQHGGDIWVEPCYFVEGMCIAEKAIITKADETLLTGNNFIFTIQQ